MKQDADHVPNQIVNGAKLAGAAGAGAPVVFLVSKSWKVIYTKEIIVLALSFR